MATDHHEPHIGEPHKHVEPLRTYLLAAGALFVLTAVTVGIAFVDLGPLNDFLALGVASTKALVIVLIFMHARHSQGITRLAIVVGLLWLAILMVGVMDDYLTRDWLSVPGR